MVVSYDIPSYFRNLNARQMLQVRDILKHAGYYLPLPQVGDRLFYDEMFLEVFEDDEVNKTLSLRMVEKKTIALPEDATVETAIESITSWSNYYRHNFKWAEKCSMVLYGTEKPTTDARSWATEYFAATESPRKIKFTLNIVSSYTEVLKIQDDNAWLYDDNMIHWKSENPYRLYPIYDIPDTTDRMIVRDLFNRLFFIKDTAFVVVDETNVTCDYHDLDVLKGHQDTVIQLYSVPPVELVNGPFIEEMKKLLIDAYFNKLKSHEYIRDKNFAVSLIEGEIIDSGTLYGASILESYSYELIKCTSPNVDMERFHIGIRLFGQDLLYELLTQ